jgi:integrase
MGRPRKNNTHLPRCVYPKHGAFYYVKRGKWEWLGDNLVAALKAYAERFEAPRQGLDGLINRTLEKLRPNLSKSTLTQYRIAAQRLKKLLREFGGPGEVTPRDIVEIRAGMRDTPNMANRILSFTRQVFDQALEEGIIESNPAIGVKRLPEKKRDRLVSRNELEAIYEHAGPRLRVIIDLLIRTGQRINDVLSIRRGDITAEGIYFHQQKTGAKVLVPSTPELEEVIARAKALHGNISALTLLHNRRGKRPDYSTVKIQWDKARKAAGVENATLHDLRAVAATVGRQQGKDATALLGHTSTRQTERYLRDRMPKVAEGPSFGRLIDISKK